MSLRWFYRGLSFALGCIAGAVAPELNWRVAASLILAYIAGILWGESGHTQPWWWDE